MLDDVIQNMLTQASKAAERARQAHWEHRDTDALDWIRRAEVRLTAVRTELEQKGADHGTTEEPEGNDGGEVRPE